jgi:hypothetical protein
MKPNQCLSGDDKRRGGHRQQLCPGGCAQTLSTQFLLLLSVATIVEVLHSTVGVHKKMKWQVKCEAPPWMLDAEQAPSNLNEGSTTLSNHQLPA